MVEEQRADGVPLSHNFFNVGVNLFPTICSMVRAADPGTKNMEGQSQGDNEATSETFNDARVWGITVFRGADDEYIRLIKVEEASEGKGGIIHHLTDEREVFPIRQEKVHVVSILDQFDRLKAQEGDASYGALEAHAHGLYAEIIEEAGQGITLPDTPAEGEETTIAAINANTGAAVN